MNTFRRVRLASVLSPVLSRVPRGLADQRLANVAFRRVYEGKPSTMQRVSLGGATFLLDPFDWPQAQATMLRRYDPETVAFIVSQIPADGTYVEGGGHVGLIALQVAAARPDASIHVFEPHPLRFEQLRRNSALNGSAVTMRRCGLSDTDGELRFDSSSHKVSDAGDIRVPVVRLDDYTAAPVDVLKLDIEGHERAALTGAERLLTSNLIGAITLEIIHSEDPPAHLLAHHGFTKVPMPDLRPYLVRRVRHRAAENAAYVRDHDSRVR